MTDQHRSPRPPTPAQQRLLRRLALERGMTFAPPATARDASQLITQLQSYPREADADVRRELRAVLTDLQAPRGTSVAEDETTGHGSTARWKGGRR